MLVKVKPFVRHANLLEWEHQNEQNMYAPGYIILDQSSSGYKNVKGKRALRCRSIIKSLLLFDIILFCNICPFLDRHTHTHTDGHEPFVSTHTRALKKSILAQTAKGANMRMFNHKAWLLKSLDDKQKIKENLNVFFLFHLHDRELFLVPIPCRGRQRVLLWCRDQKEWEMHHEGSSETWKIGRRGTCCFVWVLLGPNTSYPVSMCCHTSCLERNHLSPSSLYSTQPFNSVEMRRTRFSYWLEKRFGISSIGCYILWTTVLNVTNKYKQKLLLLDSKSCKLILSSTLNSLWISAHLLLE